MRTSQCLLATLKETPKDAELLSHQLMIRAGLIRKLASGLYTWLPMGLRVLKKVSTIIREEMDAIGAQEMLMPHVQPAELWQETGRWDTFGPQLLSMTDRHHHHFCFGPTHEEVITDLMRRELSSYKQLPTCFYQIQTKFRDEIRPRFGVMRSREFIMKDAYSFHLTPESLEKTYDDMYHAYSRIFTRLGLKFRAVQADTGAIGGDGSHEFQVLADSGEDLIAYNPNTSFAANIELCPTVCDDFNRAAPAGTRGYVTTPNIKSVPEQAKHLNLETTSVLKTLLVKGTEHPVVALLLRGDHDINPLKAEKHPLVMSPFTLVPESELPSIVDCTPGFIGPIGLKVPVIADFSVRNMANFACGANKTDHHYYPVNIGIDFEEPEYRDLRLAVAGDKSPDGQGHLAFCRGIEVGHIFQLKDKYSAAMNATVLTETGDKQPMLMGCYGIGVSRVVAASIEQLADAKGICWPTSIAPFLVAIVSLNQAKSERVRQTSETLYHTLQKHRIDTLWDDRDERPGVKFADMELIGIPWQVVIGDKSLEKGVVELKNRTTGEISEIAVSEISQHLMTLLS